MFLIFVLNRIDVLPFEDGAFLQSYKWLFQTKKTSPSEIMTNCEKWHPYSTIASRYLYIALDEGIVNSHTID